MSYSQNPTTMNGLEGLEGPYKSYSSAPYTLNVHVPDSLDAATNNAMYDLVEQLPNNDIDEYVRKMCHFASKTELYKYTAAEQIDSAALIIYNMESRNYSTLIGHMTGIGKGRVAALIIRYAVLHLRKQPIFVTVQPDLFTDIHRDLSDIGCAHFKPFIVNGKERKSTIFGTDSEGNEIVIYEPPADQTKIIRNREVPAQYHYIDATYSQFNSEEYVDKRAFIKSIAYDNIIIMDESHNASGALKEEKKKDETVLTASNTTKLFMELIGLSRNQVFLSATAIKKAENLPLYAKNTCIKEAGLSDNELIKAINNGGDALAEIVNMNLTYEGQYQAFKRPYDGVEVNYITLNQDAEAFGLPNLEKEHIAISDRINEILRRITKFQEDHITPFVKEKDNAMALDYSEIAQRKGTIELGISNPNLFSKIFNLNSQMLFAITAPSSALLAERYLKRGIKPVIYFRNTMAAFLEQMETGELDANGEPKTIKPGDIIRSDFMEVLARALTMTRRITINKADADDILETRNDNIKKTQYGKDTMPSRRTVISKLNTDKKKPKAKSEYKMIQLDELSPEANIEYMAIMNEIKSAASGLSISPIDIIREYLEAKGYLMAEVTGRKYKLISRSENTSLVDVRKKEAKQDAFRKFNNNEVDVLLINMSGSTGSSAHAIPTSTVTKVSPTIPTSLKPYNEVKQRVGIIVQPELDINVEVQKRGRIFRTGQVYMPIYSYLISAIPAQQRLMMMLQRKLKTLDANTSANQKASSSILETPDFLNKYGDEIVVNWLRENRDVNTIIGDPCDIFNPKAIKEEDAALRVTGRIAILPVDIQQKFYTEVIDEYNRYIKQLKEMGRYDLEVTFLPLNAETIATRMHTPPTGGKSKFGQASVIEKCMCDNLKYPLTRKEVDDIVSRNIKDTTAEELRQNTIDEFKQHTEQKFKTALAHISENHQESLDNIIFEKKYTKLTDEKQKAEYYTERVKQLNLSKDSSINITKQQFMNKSSRLLKYFNFFYTGRAVKYPLSDVEKVKSDDNSGKTEKNNTQMIDAIFLGFYLKKDIDKRFTPSNVEMRFALANGLRMVEITASDTFEPYVNAIMSAPLTKMQLNGGLGKIINTKPTIEDAGNDMIWVRSEYNQEFINEIRNIPGRRYIGYEKVNAFPKSQLEAVNKAIQKYYGDATDMEVFYVKTNFSGRWNTHIHNYSFYHKFDENERVWYFDIKHKDTVLADVKRIMGGKYETDAEDTQNQTEISYTNTHDTTLNESIDLSTIDQKEYDNWVLQNWDTLCKEHAKPRIEYFIITGNILAAMPKTSGTLVRFTTIDGTEKEGIIPFYQETYRQSFNSGKVALNAAFAAPAVKALAIDAQLAEKATGVIIARNDDTTFSIGVPQNKQYAAYHSLKTESAQQIRQLLTTQFTNTTGGEKMWAKTTINNIEPLMKIFGELQLYIEVPAHFAESIMETQPQPQRKQRLQATQPTASTIISALASVLTQNSGQRAKTVSGIHPNIKMV